MIRKKCEEIKNLIDEDTTSSTFLQEDFDKFYEHLLSNLKEQA